MPKDEQESVIEGACINVFDTEPEKRKILCFDVNESGLIALGTETENNKSICVYTENMVFLYRILYVMALLVLNGTVMILKYILFAVMML